MISFLIRLAEKGLLPDFFIRIGIKQLSKVRLDFAKMKNLEKEMLKNKILSQQMVSF